MQTNVLVSICYDHSYFNKFSCFIILLESFISLFLLIYSLVTAKPQQIRKLLFTVLYPWINNTDLNHWKFVSFFSFRISSELNMFTIVWVKKALSAFTLLAIYFIKWLQEMCVCVFTSIHLEGFICLEQLGMPGKRSTMLCWRRWIPLPVPFISVLECRA